MRGSVAQRLFSHFEASTSFSSPLGHFKGRAGIRSSYSNAADATYSASSSGAQIPAPLLNMQGGATNKYSLFRAYFLLSKARLSMLVASTASAGYVLGSGSDVDWAQLGYTTLGTFLAAASANALNQVWEKDNDARMKRTMNRPLPSGRLGMGHALGFAAAAGTVGIALLQATTNDTAATLGAANIGLYSLIYTPLKVLHPINTWVGAVVGAVPPLMGWAAASPQGSLDPPAWLLALTLYFWQMPHFMALAWMCKADYAAGGYKMLSNIDLTGRRVALCALRNALYLAPLGFLAADLGLTSDAFSYESLALSLAMALAAARFARAPSQDAARTLFKGSLLHLPLLMGCMLLHRTPQGAAQPARDSVAVAALREAWASVEAVGITAWQAVSGDSDERLALRMRRSGLECPTRLHCDEGEGKGKGKDASQADALQSRPALGELHEERGPRGEEGTVDPKSD